MNLQDIFAYCLAGLMVLGFAYLAWASRRRENNKEKKDK
jgi:uncharacterized iron-regulated membrane protein